MFLIASRRIPVFFIFILGVLLFSATHAQAQSRFNADSANRARRQAISALKALQQHRLDSAQASRKHIADSLKAFREHRADSLASIRKYRNSRRYKDSVRDARETRLATIREVRQAHLDSMKNVRERITDSIVAVREARMAIIRKGQKRRADSLMSIRNYRNSKRFKDSVAIVRRAFSDSLAAIRKARTDSMIAVRKAHMDSLRAERKKITDSLTAVRKLRTDSLTAKRKARDAELAKKKEHAEREQKIKEKNEANKAQLAFELKIKKKRSVYSNEKMLKKKWTAPRRAVQNTFTHYNYYFNANRKMEEAEANMERRARDNWDERIPLFSFDPLKDSAVFATDMDSVIQKTSLGIQIHDPRTKWGDDLYLLLGKAYYYKGDFENASASFKYIVALHEREKAEKAKKEAYSNKSVYGKRKASTSIVAPGEKGINSIIKREPATNEGLLWLTRSFITYKHTGEAEAVLDLISNDPNFPKELNGKLALEKAYLALSQQNDKLAASNLSIVTADKSIPTDQRRRAAFLAGQLMEEQGDFNQAATQFGIVSDLHPKLEMDFYARRNRAYAMMQSGGVQQDAIASLKDMLNDAKFLPYYEQVYYVLGKLSANAGNSKDAVAYLEKSVTTAKSTRKQKALSFAALGNLYFNQAQYPLAKSAFDSVNRFASAAPNDSDVALALHRAPLVSKVAIPAYVIHHQDSLLELSTLSEKDQKAVAKRFIHKLEKLRADSISISENGGANADVSDGDNTTAGATSWYFSSPASLQQGYIDFKSKWGNRPLMDNWQRSASGGFTSNAANNNNAAQNDADANDASQETDENGLPTIDAVMAFIPNSKEAKAVAVGRLQRAYVDLATAYIQQFEDYPRATTTLDTFDKRWALNPYTAEAAYLRYLIALRQNHLNEAQQIAQKLRKNFPGTQWAGFVSSSDQSASAGNDVAESESVGTYYDQTYELLQQRKYDEVLSRTHIAHNRFSDDNYNKRFQIVEAMAHAGAAQYAQADTILNKFLKNHPQDPLKPWAEQILAYVNSNRPKDTIKPKLDSTASIPGKTATPSKLPLGQPPIDTSSLPVPSTYTYRPAEPHYFAIVFEKMDPRAMGIKAGLADLNSFRHSDEKLETQIIPLKSGKALVVVQSFKNIIAARKYMNEVSAAKQVFREFKPNEYEPFIISESNFRKLSQDADATDYLIFFKSKY
ncbi:MAG: hypothetical protein JST06_10980 [Bacteroidetes bacterium]|nr:hypothetical protein [Bacteroidota bacterium]